MEKRGFNIVNMFKKETIGKELDFFTIKDDMELMKYCFANLF